MYKPNVAEIMDVMQQKRYVFVGPELPHYLNIIGIRARHPKMGAFCDLILAITFDENGNSIVEYFNACTNPAWYYLKNKESEGPVCVLCEGNYFNVFEIREHKGLDALMQTNQMRFERLKEGKPDGRKRKERLGTSICRADNEGVSSLVYKNMPASQVIQSGYEKFMQLCELHRKYHGNFFNYTLLTEDDI